MILVVLVVSGASIVLLPPPTSRGRRGSGSPRSPSTSRTGSVSRRTATPRSACSGICGPWRSRSSSTWCGRSGDPGLGQAGLSSAGPFLVAARGAAASAIHRWTLGPGEGVGWRRLLAERRDHVQDGDAYWYQLSLTRVDGLLIGCALAVVVVSLRGPTARGGRACSTRPDGSAAGWAASPGGAWRARSAWSACRRRRGIVWTGATGSVLPELLIGPGLPLFEMAVGARHRQRGGQPSRRHGEGVSLRPLVWIGRRSYAIYVLHPMFLAWRGSYVADTQARPDGAVGVTFVVAGLSYRYYEAPILRLKGASAPAGRSRRRRADPRRPSSTSVRPALRPPAPNGRSDQTRAWRRCRAPRPARRRWRRCGPARSRRARGPARSRSAPSFVVQGNEDIRPSSTP